MFYISVVISVIFISIILYIIRKKFTKPEAEIKINFIDFKKNNFFDEITLEFHNNIIIYKNKIKEEKLIIPISVFRKKKIIYIQITILNSNEKVEKTFKISIYKNYINDVKIKNIITKKLFFMEKK